MSIGMIRKRSGEVVPFEASKISSAIAKAMAAAGEQEQVDPGELARHVISMLEARPAEAAAPPAVEEVQDIVEEVLIRRGMPRAAKAYILYRQQHAEIRASKQLLGVKDELKLTLNAAVVLQRRYLQKNAEGEVAETPDQMFRRVAHAIAAPEANYAADSSAIEEQFYRLMVSLDFLPNSPTLMNAGTDVGQLSACFVLPVEDSLVGIFETLKSMALVHKSGGGTGFSFSRLRPRGDIVQSTMGIASGPLSFMRIFDITTDVIKQGGRRRGANMGILSCHHPDILDFVTVKEREGQLANFNLSVGVTDAFMEAVAADQPYELRNPRTGLVVGTRRAREVFQLMVSQAWRTGDPGVIFLDAINRANPTPELGQIEATNPCGEQPLLPWESCNLGSINLANMIKDGHLDREKLQRTIHLAVRFLDNVIDVNRYPLQPTAEITRGNRKIGLGAMGLADALVLLGVPYDSADAVSVGEQIATILEDESRRASAELAQQRGSFPNFRRSRFAESGVPMRNATTTSIAPTGTISIIAGCSSGIEPLFALSYVRHVIEGSRLVEVNPLFERQARQRGFHSRDLMLEVARRGGIREMEAIPAETRRVFATAFDVAPEWHVRMQAAFQRHCDNAVSKTVNFSAGAPLEQVEQAFRLAYESGCKGITVYRYGSRAQQVLRLNDDGAASTKPHSGYVEVGGEFSGGCSTGTC